MYGKLKNNYFFALIAATLVAVTGYISALLRQNLTAQSSAIVRSFPDINLYTIILAFIVSIIIWLISKKIDVIKIFITTFAAYVILLVCCAILINIVEPYSTVHTIIASVMYMSISIFTGIMMVSIWGIINRNSSYVTGVKHYVFLALAILVVSNVILILLNSMELLDLVSVNILTAVIVVSVMMLLVVVKFWERKVAADTSTDAKPHITKNNFPWFKVAFILATSTVVYSLLSLFYKASLTSNIQVNYKFYIGFILFTLCAWTILSYWALRNKGWKFTMMLGAGLCLLFTAVFIIYTNSYEDQSQMPLLFLHICLGNARALLLFPLLQLLYLCLPYADRFRMKVGTELLVMPVIELIPTMFTILLLATNMSAPNVIYIQSLCIIIFLAMLWMINNVGTKMSKLKS